MKEIVLLLFFFAPLISMESNVTITESDSGDEPSILQLIRDDRATLIRRQSFDEVAMITKKSMTPENDEKNGTLVFRVIKHKDEVLGFTAYDTSITNKAQVALVVVDGYHRNKKYAQKLLASTVNAIRTGSKESVDIWAYVSKDNKVACHIWEKVAGNIPDATLHCEEGTDKASDEFILHLK